VCRESAFLSRVASAPVTVQRLASNTGIIMLVGQKIALGRVHVGQVVTVHVADDTMTIDLGGDDTRTIRRTTTHPVRSIKAHRPRSTTDTQEASQMTTRPVIDLPAGPAMRTANGQQVAFAARSGGRLTGGAAADGTYCVWLTDRGQAQAVLWPPGYRAQLDPLEILDPDGQIVAREGDTLIVGGAAIPVDPAPCTLGQSAAFYIQSIA
jgi:hypothetical protein